MSAPKAFVAGFLLCCVLITSLWTAYIRGRNDEQFEYLKTIPRLYLLSKSCNTPT